MLAVPNNTVEIKGVTENGSIVTIISESFLTLYHNVTMYDNSSEMNAAPSSPLGSVPLISVPLSKASAR